MQSRTGITERVTTQYCPQVLQYTLPGYFSDLYGPEQWRMDSGDIFTVYTWLQVTPLSRDESLPPAPSPQILYVGVGSLFSVTHSALANKTRIR